MHSPISISRKPPHRYGPLGGFAHLETLVARLRAEAGPQNTLLLDGGDTWQGSWTAHSTQGAAWSPSQPARRRRDDVALGNDLWRGGGAAQPGGVQRQLLAQNVFLTDEAAFDGAEAFDAETGRVFRPYGAGGRRPAHRGHRPVLSVSADRPSSPFCLQLDVRHS